MRGWNQALFYWHNENIFPDIWYELLLAEKNVLVIVCIILLCILGAAHYLFMGSAVVVKFENDKAARFPFHLSVKSKWSVINPKLGGHISSCWCCFETQHVDHLSTVILSSCLWSADFCHMCWGMLGSFKGFVRLRVWAEPEWTGLKLLGQDISETNENWVRTKAN